MPEPIPAPNPVPPAPVPARAPWARLSATRRQQLTSLLGQLLARLHEARRAGEGGRD
jgi:hypothetical protein